MAGSWYVIGHFIDFLWYMFCLTHCHNLFSNYMDRKLLAYWIVLYLSRYLKIVKYFWKIRLYILIANVHWFSLFVYLHTSFPLYLSETMKIAWYIVDEKRITKFYACLGSLYSSKTIKNRHIKHLFVKREIELLIFYWQYITLCSYFISAHWYEK